MHTGRRYQPKEFFIWTFSSTMALLIYVSVPTILYHFGFKFISIPWQLIAILGTALSFIVGFKNNASYSRIWEARQIYGGIINSSRSFGYTLRDVVGDQEIVKKNVLSPLCLVDSLEISTQRAKELGKYDIKKQ